MNIQLGELIKKIREERDLTLKEVAGQAISVTNLSNFEKGLSMIKADTFFKVAHNLGIDSHMFAYYFDEFHKENDPAFSWIENISQQLNSHNYSKALELVRICPKQSELSYHQLAIIRSTVCLLVAEKMGADLLSSDERFLIKDMLKTLTRFDNWCISEYALYEAALRNPDLCKFTIESVEFKAKTIIAQLKKSRTYDDATLVDMLMIVLIASIRFLSYKERYREAELMIYQIKELHFLSVIPYTEIRLLSLYMEEVYLKLRQNDITGVFLARKILNYIDAQIDLFQHPTDPDFRNQFVTTVHKLNKTGESLDGFH